MKTMLLGAACAAMLGMVLWACWPETPAAPVKAQAPLLSAPAPTLAQAHPQPLPAPPAATDAEPRRVPLLPTGPQLPAAQSLLETRDGDPRTPPITRSEVKGEQPTAEELADPKLYARYEARQNLRTYAAFIQATRQEVPNLEAAIERGRREGIPADKIAKVEDKIRRMEAMQQQLLQEHPELKDMQ